MFRIPAAYQMDMDFDTARSVMGGNILEQMENIKMRWDLHCSGRTPFEDDSGFYECWQYEVNAFNVIYKELRPLFVGDDND